MSNQADGYRLPTPITGYDLQCVSFQFPDNQEYKAALYGALRALTVWMSWERTGDTSAQQAAVYLREIIWSSLTIDGCKPDLPVDTGGDNYGHTSVADIIELLEELTDMKYRIGDQLYEPVIDLVPCDCGSGGGTGGGQTGGNSGSEVPGGSSGGSYGEFLTALDVCTNINIILTEYDEAFDRLGSGLYRASIFEFLGERVNELIDDIQLQLTLVETVIDNPQFLPVFRKAVVAALPDPVGKFTRSMMRQITKRIPLVFDNAPMRDAFTLASELVNLERLDTLYLPFKGTGEYSGACQATFQELGRTPFEGTGGSASGPTTIDFFVAGELRYKAQKWDINRNLVGEAFDLGVTPAGLELVTFATTDVYQTGQPGGFAELALQQFNELLEPPAWENISAMGRPTEPGYWQERGSTDPQAQDVLDELYIQFGGGYERVNLGNVNPGYGLVEVDLRVYDNPSPPASAPGNFIGSLFLLFEVIE